MPSFSLTSNMITMTRLLSLCAAIIIYAAFGYPTPDRPDWPEFWVGILLISAATLPRAALSLRRTPRSPRIWVQGAHYLLLYGISIPLIIGILSGHSPGAIIRDLVPFLFLMLPLFLFDLMNRLPVRHYHFLIGLIMLAGLIFSIRGIIVLQSGPVGLDELDGLYLVNAPTVLFAALILIGLAADRFSYKFPFISFIFVSIAIIPVYAMGMVLQRASFAALAITAIFLWLMICRRSMIRGIVSACFACAFFWLFQDQMASLTERLFHKHVSVGNNMRFLELEAVWDQVSVSSVSMFFGQGWGALVQSPAVGGLSVNYTHSLLSSALLKTGLCGLFLTLFYLFGLSLRFRRLYTVNPILFFALFWPFLIDIFLYASYKSLDFGLILLLIATYAERRDHEEKENTPLNEKPQPPNSPHQPCLSAI